MHHIQYVAVFLDCLGLSNRDEPGISAKSFLVFPCVFFRTHGMVSRNACAHTNLLL